MKKLVLALTLVMLSSTAFAYNNSCREAEFLVLSDIRTPEDINWTSLTTRLNNNKTKVIEQISLLYGDKVATAG
jgi:hypothetical protein